jgi:small redox-active disulfide protein 2
MKVTVYGPGCARCEQTARLIEAVLQAEGIVFILEKVSDFALIAQAGVMATPGVALDGRLVSTGKLPTEAEIKGWLK